MEIKEHNPLQGGKGFPASHLAMSHNPVMDYFPITAQPVWFYFVLIAKLCRYYLICVQKQNCLHLCQKKNNPTTHNLTVQITMHAANYQSLTHFNLQQSWDCFSSPYLHHYTHITHHAVLFAFGLKLWSFFPPAINSCLKEPLHQCASACMPEICIVWFIKVSSLPIWDQDFSFMWKKTRLHVSFQMFFFQGNTCRLKT